MKEFLIGAAAWIAGGLFITFFGRSYDQWRYQHFGRPKTMANPGNASQREYDIIAALVTVGGLIWLIFSTLHG